MFSSDGFCKMVYLLCFVIDCCDLAIFIWFYYMVHVQVSEIIGANKSLEHTLKMKSMVWLYINSNSFLFVGIIRYFQQCHLTLVYQTPFYHHHMFLYNLIQYTTLTNIPTLCGFEGYASESYKS